MQDADARRQRKLPHRARRTKRVFDRAQMPNHNDVEAPAARDRIRIGFCVLSRTPNSEPRTPRNGLVDYAHLWAQMRRQRFAGLRLKHDQTSGELQGLARSSTSWQVFVEVRSGECNQQRALWMVKVKATDRRVTAPRVQGHQQTVRFTLVSLNDARSVAKSSENASPANGSQPVPVARAGRSGGDDSNLHVAF